ncbi:Rieske (2Fe-2S) protein [Motilibacter deserti]|uniref:Rieske (2Fe-2S) protein n=1 Tax=Motilibacter deserti TaxID=2714956 RepID=A0ABX0GTG2_9ACTN|nr:Rieske (2Fe-2S) protein [Motilibacter deserti]
MSTHVLGPAEAIPEGEGRAFVVGGEQVAVFRLRGGALRAVQAQCPHRGGPLADGLVDAEVVVCPLHGYAYELADGCARSGAGALLVYDVEADPAGQLVVRLPGRRVEEVGGAAQARLEDAFAEPVA